MNTGEYAAITPEGFSGTPSPASHRWGRGTRHDTGSTGHVTSATGGGAVAQ